MSTSISYDSDLTALQDMLGGRWTSDESLLSSMCRHALVPMGKLFRPILLLASTRAVGGRIEHVLPAAVGAESGHVASLVHDDIIDDDALRRGRPAVHTAYGSGNAIVAGDALLFDLFLCLAECRKAGADDTRIVTALEIVSRSGLELCRGQSLEAELTEAGSRDLDRYVLMIKLKTGALFRGSCQVGATLGGGTAAEIAALGTYGDELGIAFQMCDDLFSYTAGTDETIGKSILSDIRNKRMTLPIILAHRDADVDTELKLASAFENQSLDVLSAVLAETGAIEKSRALAVRHAETARDALKVLRPSAARNELELYAGRAIDRIR